MSDNTHCAPDARHAQGPTSAGTTSAMYEQPERVPTTPEEIDAYFRRRVARLEVERTAHERMLSALKHFQAIHRSSGATEGADIIEGLVAEQTRLLDRVSGALAAVRTTRARP